MLHTETVYIRALPPALGTSLRQLSPTRRRRLREPACRQLPGGGYISRLSRFLTLPFGFQYAIRLN